MTQAPVPSPPPWIDAEAANEVLEQLAEEIADRFWDTIQDTFKDADIPTMKAQVGKDALRTFLSRTNTVDLPYLQDPAYYDKYRKGVYPPLSSTYWMGLLAARPYFESEQATFRRLWREHVEP